MITAENITIIENGQVRPYIKYISIKIDCNLDKVYFFGERFIKDDTKVDMVVVSRKQYANGAVLEPVLYSFKGVVNSMSTVDNKLTIDITTEWDEYEDEEFPKKTINNG